MRHSRDTEPDPLPPIPDILCRDCKRTKPECLLSGISCDHYICVQNLEELQRQLLALQKRETELLQSNERQAIEAVCKFLSDITLSGFSFGMRTLITKALKTGAWRLKLGS